MFSYIARRVFATIPVMMIVALFVFSLLYIAPGDPAAVIAGDQASPEDVEKINDFCNSGTTISAIDLNSRFEIEPGVKNMTKLAEFLSNFFKK